MNKTGNILMAAAALVLAIIAGCSKVEYTGGKDTPTETFVRYTLDWEGQTEVPSEITVAMSRILHTVHFSCLMDSLGTMKSVFQDSTMTPCDTLTGLTMPNGEYYIAAFNSTPDSYTISGYESFISDNAASMREIYILCPPLTEEEKEQLIGEDVADFNPTQAYIGNMSPVFTDVQKVNIHPEIDTTVTLSPRPLTQDIIFRIGVETDIEVDILSIKAEISGVAGKIQLMTGHISDTATFRVPFVMEKRRRDTQADIYEGRITTLGIFPSPDKTFITGPGILQLSIHAEADGHERVFRVGINLKQSITEAGLMEKVSDSERLFRTTKPEAVLDIASRLRISKNQVVLDGNGQGVEEWFENEDLEFEI